MRASQLMAYDVVARNVLLHRRLFAWHRRMLIAAGCDARCELASPLCARHTLIFFVFSTWSVDDGERRGTRDGAMRCCGCFAAHVATRQQMLSIYAQVRDGGRMRARVDFANWSRSGTTRARDVQRARGTIGEHSASTAVAGHCIRTRFVAGCKCRALLVQRAIIDGEEQDRSLALVRRGRRKLRVAAAATISARALDTSRSGLRGGCDQRRGMSSCGGERPGRTTSEHPAAIPRALDVRTLKPGW